MKSWISSHRWQIAAVVFLIAYVILVILFIPIPVSIGNSPAPPIIENPVVEQYVTIEENISDGRNLPYFVAGDLAVFSFNITNTYNQSVPFNYNSSVTFLDYYGLPRNFTLDAYKSENFTEYFPLSEGSNGFRFRIVETIGDSTFQYDIGPQIVQAISPSNELSFFIGESTLLLSFIIGIPAIIYGVKEFKELGRKRTNNE